jgi:formate hydrogenlyase transcriptional activator
MTDFSTITPRYEALLGICDTLRELQRLEELVNELPGTLRQVADFTHLALLLVKPFAQESSWYVAEDRHPVVLVLKRDLPAEHVLLSWAFEHQQTAVIPEQGHNMRFAGLQEWLFDRGLQSGCAIPLTAADRRLGAIMFASEDQHKHSAEEIRFLSTVAHRVAVAANQLLMRELGALCEQYEVLREEIASTSMFEEIVGSSESLYAVLKQVAKVAPEQVTVLMTGESGTGKELIARAIHSRSRRSHGPFIRVNCAAIPPSLIAAELFGHEKGAFTGAYQRHIGRFESANRGTIFLDEIGDMPAEAQIALLRVLQEREIERVGSNRSTPVDVRVLAATNRDLSEEVKSGRFRLDLFYRLNVFPIHLPPLRERKDDILLLAKYFVGRFAASSGRKIRNIDGRTLALLQAYDWPGNIRELQNVLQRAVILCDGGTLSIEKAWLLPGLKGKSKTRIPLNSFLASEERELIEAALEQTRGRISGPRGAAARLGLPRTTLESKLKSLNINKHQFHTDGTRS